MEISEEARREITAELARTKRENVLLNLKNTELIMRNIRLRQRIKELEARYEAEELAKSEPGPGL